MNYNEIIDTALKYSMRTDQDTADMMNSFMLIVEARMNRILNVLKMSHRATLTLSEDKNYYGLPAGFRTLRDIQINHNSIEETGLSPVYVSPEEMNRLINVSSTRCSYTIIANQLQVYPLLDDQVLEIVYSRDIPPLTSDNQSNWISSESPDAYVFGLLVEISSYAKDNEAGKLWEQRFTGALSVIQNDDDVNRWSGPQLRTQLG